MNLKKITGSRIMAFSALFLTIMAGSCKKDTYVETKGVCPLVISTIPLNGATSVPLNQIISATFNEDMNASTIIHSNFSLMGPTLISGILSYDQPSKSLRFVPNSPLKLNTTYTAKITTGVKDLNGLALQEDYIWTFSTGLTLDPLVISTDPANGATGVVLNKVISAMFNMPMDTTTINTNSFTVNTGGNNIAGKISFQGSRALFTPTMALLANTVYTATITTAAKNKAGKGLSNNYIWSFTTGNLTAPTVIATDPMNNENGVQLNKTITATFSQAMDPTTINNLSFLVKQGLNTINGVISYSGNTASFNPNSDLQLGRIYTATITTTAKNNSGTSMANNYVWTFSTGDSTVAVSPDLNSVSRFGIIAGVGVSNKAGFSVINNMDVGIYPGARSSITGFPPAVIVNGNLFAADDADPVPAMLLEAKNDLTAAYLFAEGASFPAPVTVAGDLGGQTLAPGIYKSTSTLMVQNGNLTLDAQGDPNAVWIFQIASDFTTIGGSPFPSAAGGNIILSGGAQANNIYWQVGSSATIGDYTSFQGNILALTSITMNAYSRAVGRMLCSNGSVVMTSTNIITAP